MPSGRADKAPQKSLIIKESNMHEELVESIAVIVDALIDLFD